MRVFQASWLALDKDDGKNNVVDAVIDDDDDVGRVLL